jgi:16S rRNA G966 N2-methylase RsmD
MVFGSIKKRGLYTTIKMIIGELRFDKLNKIDTTDSMRNINDMTINGTFTQDCFVYTPSNSIILEDTFNYLKKQYDFSDSFLLDYGCGKGRAIIYAHKFGFKEIIGVEFVNELCVIAKNNIKKLMLQNIKIFEEDATVFKIPKNINVFYLANPFVGDIMQKVIKNIDSHRELLNKKILIIYIYPVCKNMFIENNYDIIYEYKDEVAIFEK